MTKSSLSKISLIFVMEKFMDFYQKEFDLRNQNAQYWHNKSADLFTSAHVLWKAMTEDDVFIVWDSYKMLIVNPSVINSPKKCYKFRIKKFPM